MVHLQGSEDKASPLVLCSYYRHTEDTVVLRVFLLTDWKAQNESWVTKPPDLCPTVQHRLQIFLTRAESYPIPPRPTFILPLSLFHFSQNFSSIFWNVLASYHLSTPILRIYSFIVISTFSPRHITVDVLTSQSFSLCLSPSAARLWPVSIPVVYDRLCSRETELSLKCKNAFITDSVQNTRCVHHMPSDTQCLIGLPQYFIPSTFSGMFLFAHKLSGLVSEQKFRHIIIQRAIHLFEKGEMQMSWCSKMSQFCNPRHVR